MKKVLCICVICVVNLLNAKDGEYAWKMSYSSPKYSDAYSPNIYHTFDSSIVYTRQLEIQEYMLQRLDWLHLDMDKLASREESVLVRRTDDLDLVKRTGDLIKNTDNIEAIGVWIIILLILIGIILNSILRAINKNNKLLQKCIQSE